VRFVVLVAEKAVATTYGMQIRAQHSYASKHAGTNLIEVVYYIDNGCAVYELVRKSTQKSKK